MFNCTQAASDHMREQRYGRVISMSSVSALGSAGQPNYAAAKAGIIGLTWSTANAHGPLRRHVQRDHAERRDPDDRLDPARQGVLRGDTASGRARWPSAPSAILTTWRRWWSTSPATGAGTRQRPGRSTRSGTATPCWRSPTPIRRIEADRELEPEELAKIFPDTLGKGLHEPPGTNFGKSLSERPKEEWKDLGKGVRYWQSPWEAR